MASIVQTQIYIIISSLLIFSNGEHEMAGRNRTNEVTSTPSPSQKSYISRASEAISSKWNKLKGMFQGTTTPSSTQTVPWRESNNNTTNPWRTSVPSRQGDGESPEESTTVSYFPRELNLTVATAESITTLSPKQSTSLSNNVPWWVSLVIAFGIVAAIVVMCLVHWWVRRQQTRMAPCQCKSVTEEVKVRPTTHPHLRLTPDIVPEFPIAHFPPLSSKSSSTKTLPVANPTTAERAIELKSYLNKFRAPNTITNEGENTRVGQGLIDRQNVDGDKEKYFREIQGNVRNINRSLESLQDDRKCCEDRDGSGHVRNVPGTVVCDKDKIRGVHHGSQDHLSSVRLRPPAPAPPRDSISLGIRENSLYESLGEKHIYATPAARQPGEVCSSSTAPYVHLYEDVSNISSNGMVPATSTDFLFR